MTETGNPNVRTNFKGKFTVRGVDGLDHILMLTATNDVIFLDNYTATNSQLIASLPQELRPLNYIRIPAMCTDNTSSRVKIYPDGRVTSGHSKTYELNGVSYNISDKYYA